MLRLPARQSLDELRRGNSGLGCAMCRHAAVSRLRGPKSLLVLLQAAADGRVQSLPTHHLGAERSQLRHPRATGIAGPPIGLRRQHRRNENQSAPRHCKEIDSSTPGSREIPRSRVGCPGKGRRSCWCGRGQQKWLSLREHMNECSLLEQHRIKLW